MEILAPYTRWIRTFGTGDGLEESGRVAHSLGLQAALGAWISADEAVNDSQLEELINRASIGEVDLAIVGSEVLLRGDLTEEKLLAYIERVKRALPDVPVAYADVYSQWIAHPGLVDAVDVVLANYYPYWEGIPIQSAIRALHGWHAQVVSVANGKQIIVGETGWPSDGNTVGRAVPSAEDAAFYFLNFVSWARALNIDYFYFEAFDESWKAAYEGPQGAHWGVWDKFGNLKSGMDRVFNNETITDNWSGSTLLGGPGSPTIALTVVPPIGSSDDLEGQVLHVFAVAVYIEVFGGWWTKPTFANPLTSIPPDGYWIADITTGGSDTSASRIAAFLVPFDYDPPSRSGQSNLPMQLQTVAVASVEVARTL
jgi:exo-beta-1,3-glucanase (GH17 family)